MHPYARFQRREKQVAKAQMGPKAAATGVSDHGGWAVLVTLAPDGALLDRRRMELEANTHE